MAGLVNKIKNLWGDNEEDYEYEDDMNEYDEDEEDIEDEYEEEEPVERQPQRDSYQRRNFNNSMNGGNKVVNFSATAKLQVVLFKPERFGEETRTIADELIKLHTVVLNLENTNKDMARRIIDFLSGVAYAKGGQIKKVAANTYIIIPNNVELTGDDLLDELENNGLYL
ncbi:MAG TPA: cell division protein SepF [Candidatus Limousia pullorum]|uniref:Cell division protein SepF n=1 Tax=Candidatus Limousia pullorum TaxID=2840860 RepID=A0A9D1LYZ6_9FIRM|nr:cell division protein SepF [Anaeromassilibacillus sp. An172]MCI6496850.1 cell division protein SepF [Anaeromassilibacillus sp.]MDY3780069.1 cell division protein SepF [Candidatus Limousia pullorum]OUP79591.1 cell division protein SepF [Anaeromassilibacillus sp. An172]HIU50800.1 cell division protein SepF [Candidatus Limousia pullorum]